jgi:hypothetical protein
MHFARRWVCNSMHAVPVETAARAAVCLLYLSRSLIQHGNKVFAVHLMHGTVLCIVRFESLCRSVHVVPCTISSCAAGFGGCPVSRRLWMQPPANLGSLTRLCPAVQRSGYLISAYTPRVVHVLLFCYLPGRLRLCRAGSGSIT